MTPQIDNSGLVDALMDFREQFEQADPVYIARIVSASSTVGYMTVDMLRPDGTVAERRDIRGNVAAWPGVHVRVGIDRKVHGPAEMGFLGVDGVTYANSTSVPVLLGPHGDLHGYLQADESTTLHPDQMYPLRCQPKSGLEVTVIQGLFFAEGSYRLLATSVDVDLTGNQPGAGTVRYVTLSLDADGNITATNGTAAGTVDVTDIAAVPSGEYPVAAVRLTSYASTIARKDIWGLKHLLTSDPGVTIDLVNKLIFQAIHGLEYDFTQHIVGGGG